MKKSYLFTKKTHITTTKTKIKHPVFSGIFKVVPLKTYLLVFRWKHTRSAVLVLSQCSNALYTDCFNGKTVIKDNHISYVKRISCWSKGELVYASASQTILLKFQWRRKKKTTTCLINFLNTQNQFINKMTYFFWT